MSDVYRNFTLEMTTANSVVFTVPTADVANSTPVSTFVAKTIYVVHSNPSPTKTAFQLSHYDASANLTITLAAESKTTEVFNVLAEGTYVFEAGDILYANANANSELVLSTSLLEIKQQQ